MPKTLSVQLNATGNLSDKLDEVAEAAQTAKSALEQVEDSVGQISTDMKSAAQSAGRLEEKLEDLGQVGILASESTSKVERSTQDLTIKAQGLTVVLDDAADSQRKFAGAGVVASDATDQLEEQVQETNGALGRMKVALGLESGAASASVGPNLAAADAIDELGDEAAQARNKMAGAASMAELLSLQSSALSINVGAFTIALRNLTTQVPLLVTTLGNLATAILGIGSALGAAGFGGLGVAIGGAVGHVEEITGEMATMEERMQAVQAIGREFMSMLEEAIEPLVNLTDSTNVFISLMEGLATTVRAFSQSIADSYADGPLREAIDTLSGAWMESIVGIGDSFEFMIDEMNNAGLFDVFADGIRALDDFFVFATNVTSDMLSIMGIINRNKALKSFIVELMELGRQIAGGLAPAMNVFLQLGSDVAEQLNELGSSTISTIVQIVALTLAVNRVVSILSTVMQPAAIFAGHLGDIAINSKSVTEAITRMTGRIIGGLTKISGGFGNMAQIIATTMPYMDPNENNLDRLATALHKFGGGPIEAFRQAFSALGPSISGTFETARAGVASFSRELLSNLVPATLDIKEHTVNQTKALQLLKQGFRSVGFSSVTSFTAAKASALSFTDELLTTVLPTVWTLEEATEAGGTFKIGVTKQGLDAVPIIFDSIKESISGLKPSLSGVKAGMRAVGDESGAINKVNKAFALLRGGIGNTIIPTTVLNNSFQTLTLSMAKSGGVTATLGRALQSLSDVMKGQITLTRGLRGAYATLVGTTAAASTGQIALATVTTLAAGATAILTGVTTVLTAILTKLAIVLGGIVVVLGAIVAIIGTVAAGLMLLSESGKSADDLIGDFKSTLRDLADAVMPLVVSSGNFMIDVFNSILTPINALVSGFKDIAVALGFMEAGESASAMELLSSGVQSLANIVDIVGDKFRILSGIVTSSVTQIMDILQAFLVDINFGDKLREYSSTIRDIYANALPAFGSALQQYAIQYISSAIDLIDRLVSSVITVGSAFVEAFNLESISFTDIMSAIQGIASTLTSLLGPIFNLLGSLISAIMTMGEVVIFVVKGALLLLAEVLGFVVDLIVSFVSGLTGMSGSEMAGGITDALELIVNSIGPVINAVAGIIDGFILFADIAMATLGPIGGAVLDVVDVFSGVLMPIIEGIGAAIRWQFGNIVGVISGAINFIVGYFKMLDKAFTQAIEGDWRGVVETFTSFFQNAFSNLIDFIVSRFDKIVEIVGGAFERVVERIRTAFNNLPAQIKGIFGQIAAGIEAAIVDTIGAIEFDIPEVTLGGGEIAGQSIPERTIGGQTISLDGKTSGKMFGGSANISSDARPGASERGEDAVTGGLDTGFGLLKAGKNAAMGGTAQGVQYNEGDTMNTYNQEIDADPEDKAQLSRLTKDAIEEANSFARMQLGGQ